MVKLKKAGRSIHGTLQNAIIATINDPSYSFSLPKLSDWESIVSSSGDEKQRLEFVGDAVMHLSVALYLYRLFPDATPGLYTNIRSAVNANATFTHLMVKAGAYQLPSQSHCTKAAADSFEVIVAALYLERGFAGVCTWVQEQYAPLIATARESYDECFTTSDRNVPFSSAKRHRGPHDPASTPLLKKFRLSGGHSSPQRTLMAQRVISRMKSKGKVKLRLPTKKSKLPLKMRLRSRKLRASKPQRSPSLVIDLSLDSESDEDAALPDATQGPRPSVSPPALPQQRLSPSRSDRAPSPDQTSHKRTSFQWPTQQQCSTASPTLLHPSPESSSPSTSFPPATAPPHVTPIVPQTTFESFRRSGPCIPPELNNIHIPSGSYGDPIVIEDSETES